MYARCFKEGNRYRVFIEREMATELGLKTYAELAKMFISTKKQNVFFFGGIQYVIHQDVNKL